MQTAYADKFTFAGYLKPLGGLLKRGAVEKAVLYASVIIIAFLYFHLAGFYLPLDSQMILGWGSVFLLLALKRIDRFRVPPLRIVFVLLSVFVTLRYWIWRSTETLVYTGPLDFIAMSVLYLAELYALSVHFLGIFSNIWPMRAKIAPLPQDTSLYPTVDVFIPTYNEPPDIVKITVTAAMNIDYPKDKLKVHLLDDGASIALRNDPKTSQKAWERYYALKSIANEAGAEYVTRETNRKAKAGNVNHALGVTGSDLILMLDCDHVPTKDILKNTVGWFLKDNNLAFVQTPHFFINPSPVEKNLAVMQDAPTENEMFYRGNQPGLDLWNSSFFCGSAAVLRRGHLLEIGGISEETITEDCETALRLHQKGRTSVYIGRPMVCGLSPETFDDFIVQRSRWAQGMTQIFVLNNPLTAKGLKLYQRLCYFNNCFFWFFGISRFVFYIAPAAFLIGGLKIYFASVTQVLAYAIPHLIASIILMDFFYGKFRWPFFSELFESVQSLFLLPVVFSVIANPRKPSFKVTPKGQSLESEFMSGLALPFSLMCIVLLAAIPVAMMKWFQYPLHRDVILITLAWCIFNFSLAMSSFSAFMERRQIRRHHRLWAKGSVLMHITRLNRGMECAVSDISLSGIGLMVDPSVDIKPLEHVVIEARDSLGEKYMIESRVQRHVEKGGMLYCGCEFSIKDASKFSNIVRYVYGDSQRWADCWNSRRAANPFKVLYFVLRMTCRGFGRIALALPQILFTPVINSLKARLQPANGSALK